MHLCDCGAPAANYANIGGCAMPRCGACAIAAEHDDLAEYYGVRYVYLDGRHWIDGVAMSYAAALAAWYEARYGVRGAEAA